MPAYLARAPAAPRDYAACSGCGLCLLVCPSWRRSHDPRLTAQGLAKALQCGARAPELVEAIEACSLCGACDPVCPEGIDLSGLIIELRRQLPRPAAETGEIVGAGETAVGPASAAISAAPTSAALLLPGPDLRADAAVLERVTALLGLAVADDDGADIALALELGVEIPSRRLQQFLAPLRGRALVAADGLLLRQLRRWLPGSRRMSLGAALSSMAAVRGKLGAADLYAIEPRAYHADYERMVSYYDRLRSETGCSLNLDLQRIAIPAVAPGLPRQPGRVADADATQIRWILQGRQPARIVVENLADRAAFQQLCDVPVLYIADLAQDGAMNEEAPRAFG